MLESGPFVPMAAPADPMQEAALGGISSLPNPPDNRPKDPADVGNPARGRSRPRVLMANEPRAYREGIAAVISQLRPTVEVETVEPAALDDSIKRYVPDMVICSKATETLKGRVRVWVELYPENGAVSVANIGGRRVEYTEIQLPDLLSIVDRAEELARAD